MGLIIGYFVLRTGSLSGPRNHSAFIINLLSLFEMGTVCTVILQGMLSWWGIWLRLSCWRRVSLPFLLFVRKESTAFTIPLPENSQLSTRQRAMICFRSAAMVLALLAFCVCLFSGVQTYGGRARFDFYETGTGTGKEAAALGEVPISAVVVRGSEVVSTAHNLRETEKNALFHAELLAIDRACKKLGAGDCMSAS